MTLIAKRLIIIVGTLIFALIGMAIVTEPFQLSNFINTYVVYFVIITIFCFILWYGWLKGNENDNTFLNFIKVFALIEITALINIDLFQFSDIIFWLNLIIWIAISWIITDVEKTDKLNYVTYYLFSTFIATTAYITIGYNPIFSYSYEPISRISFINELLDIRLMLGIFFILFIVIKSVIIALREGKFELSKINQIEIEKNKKNKWLKVIMPIIVVISFVINQVVIGLMNFISMVIQKIINYSFLIGKISAKYFLEILLNSFQLFQMIFVLVFIMLVSKVARVLTPQIIDYLLEGTLLSLSSFGLIIWYIFLIVSSMFAIIFILSIEFKNKKLFFDKITFEKNLIAKSLGLTTVFIMIWLSGFILFLLSQIKYLSFIGFERIGIYNLLFIVVISVGIFYYVQKTVFRKEKQ